MTSAVVGSIELDLQCHFGQIYVCYTVVYVYHTVASLITSLYFMLLRNSA